MTKQKIVKKIKDKVLETVYVLAETLNGEKKLKLISYKNGEKIKKVVRDHYNKENDDKTE